jgi:hypothetical protein
LSKVSADQKFKKVNDDPNNWMDKAFEQIFAFLLSNNILEEGLA